MDPTCVMLGALDELALVEEFPVLVAIDDFNWLYEPTEYFYDERYIPPQQLSLVSAFRMFAADDEHRSRVKREYKWQRGEPEYPDHFFSERPHLPFSLPETPSREPPRMPLANGFVVAAMSHGRLPTDGVSDGQRDSRFRKLVDLGRATGPCRPLASKSCGRSWSTSRQRGTWSSRRVTRSWRTSRCGTAGCRGASSRRCRSSLTSRSRSIR